jgi:AcrR family transcriptional regulator
VAIEVENGWDRRRRKVSLSIEAAALDCIADSGMQATTVEQIARAAGIHERTFFRYFAAKEDALLALPRRAMACVCEELAARPEGEPLIDSLRHATEQTGERLREDDALRRRWGQALLRSPELGARVTAEMSNPTTATVALVVAQRLGEDPSSPRVGVLTAALLAVLSYTWSEWMASEGANDLAASVADAFRILEETALRPFEASEHAELERLRAENADLRLERDIFKRMAAMAMEASPVIEGESGHTRFDSARRGERPAPRTSDNVSSPPGVPTSKASTPR